MSTKANAVPISRFINLQGEHEATGLDRRDLKYLDTPAPRQRATTAAQALQKIGHACPARLAYISID
jgi:hypothetical protein